MSVADFNAFRRGKIEILDEKIMGCMRQFVHAQREEQKELQAKLNQYTIEMKKLKG